MKKEIIKNAHCKYFEGQTGLCQAKEFKRCNPINCKTYTIDELSTILDLQKQLQHKEQKLKHLQEDYAELEQRHSESYQELIRLKQECEKLIEKLNYAAERNSCYQQALDTITGLLLSTLDPFEEDDKEQQLHYCKEIAENILTIINEVKEK